MFLSQVISLNWATRGAIFIYSLISTAWQQQMPTRLRKKFSCLFLSSSLLRWVRRTYRISNFFSNEPVRNSLHDWIRRSVMFKRPTTCSFLIEATPLPQTNEFGYPLNPTGLLQRIDQIITLFLFASTQLNLCNASNIQVIFSPSRGIDRPFAPQVSSIQVARNTMHWIISLKPVFEAKRRQNRTSDGTVRLCSSISGENTSLEESHVEILESAAAFNWGQ